MSRKVEYMISKRREAFGFFRKGVTGGKTGQFPLAGNEPEANTKRNHRFSLASGSSAKRCCPLKQLMAHLHFGSSQL